LFLSNPTRPAREERRAFGGHPPQILLVLGGMGGLTILAGMIALLILQLIFQLTKDSVLN